MGKRDLDHGRAPGWRDALRDILSGVGDLAAFPAGALALTRVPHADGHAVLVLPGFLSSDRPMWPLRRYLSAIGYHAYPWELGINLGFSSKYAYDIEDLIEHRLKEVFLAAGDRKISMVGWSLGGLYAKQLARRYPHLIRDVITLGSPIRGDISQVSIWRIYEWITGTRLSDPDIVRKLRELTEPLAGVPMTAIYSRHDGVVGLQNASEAPGPLTQNIEVGAAHLGMGIDAFVMYLIAHRLAQSERTTWQPLNVARLRQRFDAERRIF